MLLNSLSVLSDQLADQALNSEALRVKREEAAKGLVAGLEAARSTGKLEFRGDDDTIGGAAFNDAARKGYLMHTATTIRDELGRVEAEAPADEGRMNAAIEALRTKLAGPGIAGDMADLVQAELEDVGGRYRERVGKARAAAGRAETYVTGIRLLDSLRAEAEGAAAAGNVGGAISAEASHRALIDRMVADGLMTGPQAIAAERRRATGIVAAGALAGLDEADEEGGEMAMDRHVRMVSDTIADPDVRRRVAGMMAARQKKRGRLAAGAERAGSRAFKLRSGELWKEALDEHASGRLDEAWLMENRDRMTPADYTRARKLVDREEEDDDVKTARTDTLVYNYVMDQADEGVDITDDVEDHYVEGRLTRADRDRLISRAARARDAGLKEGRRIIRDALRPGLGASMFGDDTKLKTQMNEADVAFEAWYTEATEAQGKSPSRDEIKAMTGQLIRSVRPPSPKAAGGSPAERPMMVDLDQEIKSLVKKVKAGEISDAEYVDRLIAIDRERNRYENPAPAEASKP